MTSDAPHPGTRRLRAVAFDLDDTLFDHRGSVAAGVAGFLDGLGIAPTPALLHAWLDEEATHYERWRTGEIAFQEQRRERMRAFLPLVGVPVPGDDAGLDAVFDRYLVAYERAWCAFDDSPPLLQRLRADGYRIGLLTNGRVVQQEAKLRRVGLADAFDAVGISEELGTHKPDPGAFEALLDRLGVEAHECLFVGDDPQKDLAGALGAGLEAMLVDRHGAHADGIAAAVLARL